MATELPPYELRTSEADTFVEALLILENIKRALRGVEICAEKFPDPRKIDHDSAIIQNSLISSSISLFLACFEKNKLFSLQRDLVFKVEGGQRDYFDILLEIRNSYIAHTYGPMRQAAHWILMDDNLDIIGNGEFIAIHVAYDAEIYDKFWRFLHIAKQYIEIEISNLKDISIKKAGSLTKGEKRALKPHKAVIPGPGQFDQGRRSHRKSTSV